MDRRGICDFYERTGICRYGDGCSKRHIRREKGKILLFSGLYQSRKQDTPARADGKHDEASEEELDNFSHDMMEEVERISRIRDLLVVENVNEHMQGSVWIEFKNEKDAALVYDAVRGRVYGGIPIDVHFSHIRSLQDCICKDYKRGQCRRGLNCSFVHPRPIRSYRSIFGFHPQYHVQSQGEKRKRPPAKYPAKRPRVDHRRPSRGHRPAAESWNRPVKRSDALRSMLERSMPPPPPPP